ncbi:MAG: ORF6C domain-containing protein [Vibrio sp.]|uniref:ORF6C domain-containing protein n=1 Tax=Vibrio sp. TaxID=678 RepID=UPI003A8A490F
MSNVYQFPCSGRSSKDSEKDEPTFDEALLELANSIEPKKKGKGSKGRTEKQRTASINVKGNNNIMGNNNVIIQSLPPEKIIQEKIVIRDADVLTEAQAYNVKKCIDTLVVQEVAHGMSRQSAYGKWWKKIKEKYSVTEYKSIPQDKYDEAISFLKRQTAIKREGKPVYNESDRKYYYKAIWARAHQLRLSKNYVMTKASSIVGETVKSLTHLSIKDLKLVHRMFMSFKTK